MDLRKYLRLAGVPDALHAEALASIELARRRSKGLLWHKIKVRYLRAGKIAKLIPWGADRLLAVRPDLASWDIAPMLNITAHGDNVPWAETPDGGRPVPGSWLNTDPTSDEYRQAVAANYWCKGEHPRSAKSRKAWYRRNGGEYEAWSRGMPMDPLQYAKPWSADGVTVHHNNGAWLIVASDKWLGFIPVTVRVGFEIDNVFSGIYAPQAWYPIADHELHAPVTWSTVPRFK